MTVDSPMTEAHKRALIVAYYLSRFDRKGIRALGYVTAKEAFVEIGKALGVKTATIKHMRDSFDQSRKIGGAEQCPLTTRH